MNNLNEMIERLAEARKELAELKEETTRQHDEFVKSEPYASLIAQRTAAQDAVVALTEDIQNAALAAYKVDQNKHPHPKVNIKNFTVTEIVDPEEATNWCRTSLPAALSLNFKMVGDYAKKFGKVPGVKVYDEDRAQIASNLEPE